jgi:WD40 repeat protein
MQRQTILSGHRDCIYALAADAAPEAFFSGGADGYIARWRPRESERGAVVARLGSSVYAMRLTSNGHRLLAGCHDGGLHLLDLTEHQLQARHSLSGSVFCIEPAFGYWWIGVAGGRVYRWSPEEEKPTGHQDLSTRNVRCLLPIQERQWMVSGSSDGMLRLWDASVYPWQMLCELPAHGKSVFALAYDAQLGRLYSGGMDAQLRSWLLGEDGHPHLLQEVPAHWYTVNALWLSPEGGYLYSGSRDNTLKKWTADGLRLLERKGSTDRSSQDGHVHSVNRLLWLQGLERLVSASDDKQLMLWALEEEA